MLSLATALSSHVFCFLCRERNRTLHTVKKQDIIHAYLNHRIYIKNHARCCDAHFDENGLIRKEEFFNIPTKDQEYKADIVKMFDFYLRIIIAFSSLLKKWKLLKINIVKK